jgi:hypothetical protein
MLRPRGRAIPAMVGLAVVALLAVGLVVGFSSPSRSFVPEVIEARPAVASAAEVRGTWPAPPPMPTTPTSFLVADGVGPVVRLYSAPDVPLASKPTMANPTWEGLAVVFAVLDQHDGWLHVRVSSRPNDLTAWVQASDVSLHTVPNHVVIEVGARRVTVLHGDDVLLQAPVAVGAPATPTPLGAFFVDGTVAVPDTTGPYGPFQVSVSGFSNVYSSFGGGVGQIAMHGTNHPNLVGQPISNGCVRMANDTIRQMADLAPSGTPVEIVA